MERNPGGPTSPDGLETAVRALIGAAHEVVTAVANRLHLAVSDVAALEVLDREGPLPAGQLGHRLGLRPASVTALLDRLEAAGYIRRDRDPHDRRRSTVSRTEHARLQAGVAFDPVLDVLRQTTRDLPPDAVAELVGFVGTLTVALGDGARKARA